jgi:hypothetical protein
MSLVVKTKDASQLTDTDLDELASMGGSFGIGAISKAKEDWVLFASARLENKLHGFMFSTLERIGGTPCVLLGMLSVKPTTKRDQILKGLMGEAYHRALMAFPDEDVVVGSRFIDSDALEAFKSLTEMIPRPDHKAVGEERAWGRRLARRFGCEATYDEQSFVIKSNGQSGFMDFKSLKPGKAPADINAMFKTVSAKKAGVLVVHGWTMTENLLKLGKH